MKGYQIKALEFKKLEDYELESFQYEAYECEVNFGFDYCGMTFYIVCDRYVGWYCYVSGHEMGRTEDFLCENFTACFIKCNDYWIDILEKFLTIE